MKSVTRAQAVARMATTKRQRMPSGVALFAWEYWFTKKASIPHAGIRVRIWRTLRAKNAVPANIFAMEIDKVYGI